VVGGKYGDLSTKDEYFKFFYFKLQTSYFFLAIYSSILLRSRHHSLPSSRKVRMAPARVPIIPAPAAMIVSVIGSFV